MMFTSHQKGEIAHLKVQLRAAEKGWIVAKPTTEARYDLLLDDGQRIWRAQVKYADADCSGSDNAVHLDLRKECRNNGVKRTYSKSEIDVIVVYVPRMEKLCWIDSDLFDGAKSLTLRCKPPKNGQKKGIRFADDFIW